MNKQPVSYLQTDPRWGSLDYSAKGEKTTIRASGCGPTAMAMVLATWADPAVTPATECAWALAHGFKAPHQGTYYGYFEEAGRRYGLKTYRLNYSNLYGNDRSAYHAHAKDALDRGDLVIACMGKGTWTSSGHYVLVWKIDGNVIYINDPASTKPHRVRGDYAVFKRQVKYYWVIERPKNIPGREEDDDMDAKKLAEMLPEAFSILAEQKAGDGYEKALAYCKEAGIMKGDAHGNQMPKKPLTREEAAQMVYNIMTKRE